MARASPFLSPYFLFNVDGVGWVVCGGVGGLARQNTTRQHKIKQDETRQDLSGLEIILPGLRAFLFRGGWFGLRVRIRVRVSFRVRVRT
jgi:hypothetical protein